MAETRAFERRPRMRLILQFLAPSALGVVLMAWLVLAEAMAFWGTTTTFHLDNDGTMSNETSVVNRFGWPEILWLETAGPRKRNT